MTTGTCYDTNVLLEIVLNRRARTTAVEAVRAAEGRRCFSALTAHLEDALQVATEIAAGCSDFVTFDRGLAKCYGRVPGLSVRKLSP